MTEELEYSQGDIDEVCSEYSQTGDVAVSIQNMDKRIRELEAENERLRGENTSLLEGEPWDTIRELEAENERLKQMETTFQMHLDDIHDDMDCLDGCDRMGHEEECPRTNPVAAFAALRKRLTIAQEWIEKAPHCPHCSWNMVRSGFRLPIDTKCDCGRNDALEKIKG